jgi:hypothetical protein
VETLGHLFPGGESVREFCLEPHLRGGRWLCVAGGGFGHGVCLLGGALLLRNPPFAWNFCSYSLTFVASSPLSVCVLRHGVCVHSWRPLWRGRLNACGMMAASGRGYVLGASYRFVSQFHGVPVVWFV